MDENIDIFNSDESGILIIEPFYGGSHKQLIDTLIDGLNYGQNRISPYLISHPAKKWHWRARTGALYVSQEIPQNHKFKVLLVSSVLNLAELIALRQDLLNTKKIVYFHENQLVYPVRKEKERDFQYGYNQILTCLVADVVLFNSKYNQDSFLNSINTFFKLQPDLRPKDLKLQIAPKCRILHYPVKFPPLSAVQLDSNVLHIAWPHRWLLCNSSKSITSSTIELTREHDKDPDTFFQVLMMLMDTGYHFQVSVLGESFSQVPPVFHEAHTRLRSHIINWGHQETKQKYYEILKSSHIAVSTAKHEFYGVAMLEATYCGCLPLCPNDLVYPEFYPPECLYKDKHQLMKMLQKFCTDPNLSKTMRKNLQIDFTKFSADYLINEYKEVLCPKNAENM